MMKFCPTMQVCTCGGAFISWNGQALAFSCACFSWIDRARMQLVSTPTELGGGSVQTGPGGAFSVGEFSCDG
jgi:hypothetical protein